MPEGPSMIILKEELAPFAGKKVLAAAGQANIDFDRIRNKTIVAFRTWGKHFLICFPRFKVGYTFLLFRLLYDQRTEESHARPAITICQRRR